MRWLPPVVVTGLCALLSHALAADTPLQVISRSFQVPKTAIQDALPTPSDAPFSLTGSDGTGLQVISVEAHAVVEEPLAFTELTLRFQSPQDRIIEGQFRITLPQNASVSRFAMRINDHWQEGEVVEKQAARRAYEDFLHRRQDPALLEQGAANEFQARVFPIPARGFKDIIISYSQELVRDDDPFRIPLLGLPELGSLRIQVLVGKTSGGGAVSSLGGAVASNQVVEVVKNKWKPDRDFEVAQLHVADRLGLRHENLAVARITPVMESAPEELTSLMVLLDSSASRALGYEKQTAAVERLLRAIKDPSLPLLVACFDQGVEIIHDGKAGDFGGSQMARVRARKALGASNLEGALRFVSDYTAGHKGRRFSRVLLVTDGVATAGNTDGEKLRGAVAALKTAEVDRLDAWAMGGIREDAVLRRLVTAGLPHDGTVIDGDAPLADVARKLTQATRSNIKVAVEGSSWVWPQQLDGFQAGDQVLVYADLPASRSFVLTLSGVAMRVDRRVLAAVEKPLLQRAWVQARISRLTFQRDTLQGDADLKDALKKQITELSIRHRVLSPFTALLVLETEQDYQRYGIERRSLADILTVGPSGLAVVNRKDIVVAPVEVVEERPMPQPAPKAMAPTATAKAAPGRARASADDERSVPSADKGSPDVFKRKSTIDFSDETVEGDLVKPEGSFTESRRRVTGGAPAMRAPEEQPRPQNHRRPEPASPRPIPSPEPAPAPPPPPPPQSLDLTQRGGLVVDGQDPYDGVMAEVMAQVKRGDAKGALQRAWQWHDENVADVMALVALGEAAEAVGDAVTAMRAYGSLIDMFPTRADMRRFAGERLERIKAKEALALAVDTFEKAREERPDHPASHRLYAYALLRAGRTAEAFEAMCSSRKQQYRADGFRGVDQVLAEDIGLIGAAWVKAEPKRTADIKARIQACGGTEENAPSLRFVLNWETDANDVDFHVVDGQGGHAYFSAPALASGGRLYADVTTGYGPECFTIRGDNAARAYPYQLAAHYYSRGPMGYGMGKLQIIQHDGKGTLRTEERPFVVMKDRAYVDMGRVTGPLQ